MLASAAGASAVVETSLLFISVLLTLGAYGEYYRDTAAAAIQPNRWSWLIWSAGTGMEVATFQGVSGDFATTSVFVGSAVACCFITALIWRRGSWQPASATELACVAATVLALVAWFAFQDYWWAHVIMLAAIPISFLPTYRSAWQNPAREASPSWMLWTLGDLFALAYVLMRYDSARELPYAIIEAIAHAGVWFVLLRRRGPTRALGAAQSVGP